MKTEAIKLKRVRELDVFKGLAIAAVIMIHTTGRGVTELDVSSSSYFLHLILNRFSQFSVPAFIFASSILLSYIYRNEFCTITAGQLKTFYVKRFIRIMPPYMIWTLIYLLAKHTISGSLSDITLKSYLRCLCLGTGHFHLYFIVIIIQLYIFMPYLIYCVSRLNLRFNQILPIAAALQIVFYYVHKMVIVKYINRPASLMPWYLVLILLGIWIGINYEEYHKRVKSMIASIPIAAVSGILYTYAYHLINIGRPVSTLLFNILWYIYVTAASLSLLYISDKMNNPFLEKSGQLSFGIYLMHPMILLFMNNAFTTGNVLAFDVYTLLKFVLAYSISYVITLVLEKTTVGKYIVG